MVYIIIGIIVALLIYVITTYNKLVKLRHIVEEAFSTMDIYLKKRWDLIPNLVEIVKEYAKYEKEVIKQVTDLRVNNYKSISLEQKIDINKKIEHDIPELLAISENYPDLKANENFLELSKELTKIEDDIANSRKYYNGSVRIFNTKIQIFPNNIMAPIFRLKELKMFEVNTEEKENVKVDL